MQQRRISVVESQYHDLKMVISQSNPKYFLLVIYTCETSELDFQSEY